MQPPDSFPPGVDEVGFVLRSMIACLAQIDAHEIAASSSFANGDLVGVQEALDRMRPPSEAMGRHVLRLVGLVFSHRTIEKSNAWGNLVIPDWDEPLRDLLEMANRPVALNSVWDRRACKYSTPWVFIDRSESAELLAVHPADAHLPDTFRVAYTLKSVASGAVWMSEYNWQCGQYLTANETKLARDEVRYLQHSCWKASLSLVRLIELLFAGFEVDESRRDGDWTSDDWQFTLRHLRSLVQPNEQE